MATSTANFPDIFNGLVLMSSGVITVNKMHFNNAIQASATSQI